eukprot:15352596-Ditylum_brightwellii.AAC.1
MAVLPSDTSTQGRSGLLVDRSPLLWFWCCADRYHTAVVNCSKVFSHHFKEIGYNQVCQEDGIVSSKC